MSAVGVEAITRMVVDRELVTEETIEFTTPDNGVVVFSLRTLTAAQKQALKQALDLEFPAPPLAVVKTDAGTFTRFDLESPAYAEALAKWQQRLSMAVLASTLGLTPEEVEEFERIAPASLMTRLTSATELINGVQSEPLADLVRDAIWAPEVLAWIETYKGKPDDLVITDRALFRQIDAMIAAGYTFSEWEALTPRERILIVNWHDYKSVREAYTNWHTFERKKPSEGGNPMRMGV